MLATDIDVRIRFYQERINYLSEGSGSQRRDAEWLRVRIEELRWVQSRLATLAEYPFAPAQECRG